MKFLTVSLAFLGLLLPVMGQDKPLTKWDVEIPEFESISDGTLSKPIVKSEPITFKVLSSRTKKMDVVRAPEMPDLPSITGRIKVNVRMVEDPELPEPPEPLPELSIDDPAVIARMAELREEYQGTSLVFISASVYDHKRTLLRIHTNAGLGGEVSAWSNLDFNHFSGFSIYRVKDGINGAPYDFGILLGLGNEDTAAMTKINSLSDIGYKAPKIPKLPDLKKGGPAFVVVEGKKGSSAMNTLEQIHDLYRNDGKRMEAAFHAREKAHAERKAYLLANPTKPEDVTINFWKRDKPSAAGLKNLGTEGKR